MFGLNYHLRHMIHLRAISTDGSDALQQDAYPFHVPVIRALERLEFTTPVTFFVGENGSGKSALLGTLACGTGSITAGSQSVKTDPTLQPARLLARHLRMSWAKRTHKGLFLRAEDFFGYVKGLAQMRAGLEQDLREVDEQYKDGSKTAQGYARMPIAGELAALRERYGRGLEAYSHGEGYLTFFQARFVPNGLYLLDEPEAALSPKRQLAFVALLKQMVEQDAQFIIATHSPIILACPGATILSFNEPPIRAVEYGELEHVWLTRDFLNNPAAFLKYL
jgi:predicted ATPase